MRKKGCLFAICLLAALPLFAQTAERMEELLQTEVVSYDQAARFVLEAADRIGPANGTGIAGRAQAFTYAMEENWLPKDAVAEEDATLDGISLLIMRSFGIKGGLFYNLFRNPHYAYRELVYRDVIQGKADPKMTVSGEMLLFLTNRIFSLYEDRPWDRQLTEQDTLMQEISVRLELLALEDTSVRVTGEGVTIILSGIRFEADSAELPEDKQEDLVNIGQMIQTAVPERQLLVTGHTAQAGTEEDQLRVSLERAESIKDFLFSLGIPEDKIAVHGYGSQRPLADNSTPEGMTLNRRVEITILERQE